MPKLKDETGNVYGRLTVLGYVENDKPGAYWLCRCACGSETIVYGRNLRNGKTISCGCYRRERTPESYTFKGEVGNRYGRLVVIERAENDEYGNSRWKCQCSCGNETIVRGGDLRKGDTTSCGCYHRERSSKDNALDISGYEIGFVRVIEPTEKRDGNTIIWRCECLACGSEFERPSARILHRSGALSSCGCVTEKSDVRDTFRGTPEAREWSRAVIERDGECKKCGTFDNLHTHHIFNAADHPEVRSDVNNGVTLCKECHREFHRLYGKRLNCSLQLHDFLDDEQVLARYDARRAA